MKIFLIGGMHYLGSKLLKELLDNTEFQEILVYDKFFPHFHLFHTISLADSRLKFVEGDILDKRKLVHHMQGYDAVIHTGLINLHREIFLPEHSHYVEMNNHWGTAEVMDAAEVAGVKRAILLSSSMVYGKTVPGIPAKEEHDLLATDPVSQSIIRAEKHAIRFIGNQKIEMFILRLGSLFGLAPHTNFSYGINGWLLASRLHNKITLYGDGTDVNSYLSVDQVSSLINRILIEKFPEGIYNLSDAQISMLDLLDILKELNPELEFIFVNHHLKLPNNEIDSSLAQEIFALRNVNLYEELHKMWKVLSVPTA
jgi:UDP-glucose 4-epimerase